MTFTVLDGPNAGLERTAVSGGDGVARLTYESSAVGTDVIAASFIASDNAVRRAIVRTLAATAKGAFRTIGGASTITADDGTWIVSDRCDGTMTEVGRGKVTVHDTKLDKNFTLRSGQGYLARAKLFAAKTRKKGS